MRYRYKPELILVHPDVENSPVTRQVLNSFPAVESRLVSSPVPFLEQVRQSRHPETLGKRILLLTRHQGRFLKPCPGICDQVACCDYHVMDLGSNCPLECTYCVLQGYLNNPLMVVYANVEELLGELDEALRSQPGRIIRIGTGEFTDSLALDTLTGISRQLVPFFARRPNAFLELKTKTDEVANLRGLEPNGQTVISWSLNTPHLIATEEFKTCSLDQRLEAARLCASWGYRIGFHFDPLIHYPGWEEDYRQTVDRLYEILPAAEVAWISLGTLRFPAGLRSTIRRRFPKSRLPLGEIITGQDGKGRYFRPLRTEMYGKVAGFIRQHHPEQTLYLCMESPRVWQQAIGEETDSHSLAALLDGSLVQISGAEAAASLS